MPKQFLEMLGQRNAQLTGTGLERDLEPHPLRCGQAFERARRRLHPAAFEACDYRLRRMHALGQLLLRRPARARASIIAAASVNSSTRALKVFSYSGSLRRQGIPPPG